MVTLPPTYVMLSQGSKLLGDLSGRASSEQSVAAERRIRAIHQLPIYRRRPLNGDVELSRLRGANPERNRARV
jgi:hypothetical protein